MPPPLSFGIFGEIPLHGEFKCPPLVFQNLAEGGAFKIKYADDHYWKCLDGDPTLTFFFSWEGSEKNVALIKTEYRKCRNFSIFDPLFYGASVFFGGGGEF